LGAGHVWELGRTLRAYQYSKNHSKMSIVMGKDDRSKGMSINGIKAVKVGCGSQAEQ